jgi:hypothetical protein
MKGKGDVQVYELNYNKLIKVKFAQTFDNVSPSFEPGIQKLTSKIESMKLEALQENMQEEFQEDSAKKRAEDPNILQKKLSKVKSSKIRKK